MGYIIYLFLICSLVTIPKFYIIQMNPFERLRQTIDKVNLVYQYNDDQHEQPQRDTQPYLPQKQTQQYVIQTVNNPAEFQRVKQTYDKAQTNHLVEISQLTNRIQQLSKNLKRAEATVQSQLNDIVSLEKQNELLKENLNEQYRNIVGNDEKERKLKEEIYRINVTVNQLAIEINSERNAKKLLMKENQKLKNQVLSKDEEIKSITLKLQGEKEKVRAELQQRIQMFEYNVKKNAEDRKDYKDSLAKAQQNYQATINKYLQINDQIKQDYYSAQKQSQIANIKRKNIEETFDRITKQLQQVKQVNANLAQQLKFASSRLEQSQRQKEQLQQHNSSLGSQLEEQKRNIKVKVVEVRDETALLELEMYKRQCRQLMQQKAILNSIGRSERTMDPSYKLITSQLSGK